LGGDAAAGGKMKTTGTTRWFSSNISDTNESGYAGLPGGGRFANSFGNDGLWGNWWSATQASSTHAWYRYLGYFDGSLGRYNSAKFTGFSVRCLRD